MPTSTEVFARVAAKYGSVDPGDAEAVRQWYENTVPKLPRREIEEILGELLHNEGAPVHGTFPRSYPSRAPLPTLEDAPPAPLPTFFADGIVFLKSLLAKFRR